MPCFLEVFRPISVREQNRDKWGYSESGERASLVAKAGASLCTNQGEFFIVEMFFREEYSHLSLCLQGSGSWDHHCFLFHILPSYSSSFYPWVMDPLEFRGMSLRGHLGTLMWKCTWKSLMELGHLGELPAERAEPRFTWSTRFPFLAQHREIAAPQNQRCVAFCNFWAKRHVRRVELSTSISILGILWKLSGFMITHVIAWHGWRRLSHSRKHPRCLFPNAESYSSSFELFLWGSFQFFGSHYKTRTFHCFRKPPRWRGKCPILPDHQANHLHFCRAGAAQPGGGAVGSWWAKETKS